MRPSALRPTGVTALLPVLLIGGLVGCDALLGPGDAEPAPPTEITELPRSLTTEETAVLMSSNAFGLDLLQEILRESPNETHFLSPLSASMALAMTMNGADGETHEAMRDALRFGDLTEEEINQGYGALIGLLAELDPEVSFELANAIWYRQGLTPRSGFVSRAGEVFGADVLGLDFADPGAPDVINDWVKEATNDRIDDMVEAIPGNVVAFLLNAIHFQSDWSEPFDPDLTEDAEFHAPQGSKAVRLMDRNAELPQHGTESYVAAELPYGGQAYAMTIVVPREHHTPVGVLDELADGGWDHLVSHLSEGPVRIRLPRFELEWDRVLNDDLDALGMGMAFGAGADFTRMFEDSSPWIDEVMQKSFVRVDEEGTEAAAATQVVMDESAPLEVRADRPFLFVIRERLSGTILFLGAVMEAPSDASNG